MLCFSKLETGVLKEELDSNAYCSCETPNLFGSVCISLGFFPSLSEDVYSKEQALKSFLWTCSHVIYCWNKKNHAWEKEKGMSWPDNFWLSFNYNCPPRRRADFWSSSEAWNYKIKWDTQKMNSRNELNSSRALWNAEVCFIVLWNF